MYAQSSVNLRQGPSTEYDKVGSLSTNQSVTVTGYVETASGGVLQYWGEKHTKDSSRQSDS